MYIQNKIANLLIINNSTHLTSILSIIKNRRNIMLKQHIYLALIAIPCIVSLDLQGSDTLRFKKPPTSSRPTVEDHLASKVTWNQPLPVPPTPPARSTNYDEPILVGPWIEDLAFRPCKGKRFKPITPHYSAEIANRVGGNRLRPGFYAPDNANMRYVYSPKDFFSGYVLTFPGGQYQHVDFGILFPHQAQNLNYPLQVNCAQNDKKYFVENYFIDSYGKRIPFKFSDNPRRD
jgi:hypothetical protein